MTNNPEPVPIEQLLDEVDALQKRAVDLPYFVGSDTAEDCPEHRNSGLALVDTGRSADWPVARLCEWHTANFIAEAANAYPRLSKELRQLLEREQNRDAKHIEECDCCGDPYCAECTNADHDNYCSRVCEGRSETEDSVASNS